MVHPHSSIINPLYQWGLRKIGEDMVHLINLEMGRMEPDGMITLVMTNSLPWKPWPIEIDGLPGFTY
jgi:hypothetical protein